MAKLIVIPARLASQRLPRKLLLDETGWPLIRHVHERCLQVQDVDRVIVATDGAPLQKVVQDFGGEAVITAEDLPTGTDRVAAACQTLGLSGDDLVINVQGDEPEIDPALLDRLIDVMEEDPQLGAATAACRFPADEDPDSPHAVKVVTDMRGRALYFSRAAIPGGKPGEARRSVDWPLLHLGVYAYRREALEAFVSSDRGSLEAAESLEQLRLLEMGIAIGVVTCEGASSGVDTRDDFLAFRSRVEGVSEE